MKQKHVVIRATGFDLNVTSIVKPLKTTHLHSNYRDIKTNSCLMQCNSIAERSYRSFLQYYHSAFSKHLSFYP